jgi:tape measure domain-containing protein
MAENIDDRVVAMHFDNAAFEKKIESTLVSLDKLQKSLDFANGKKGFEDVSAAANNMNLDKIASGVDNISSKFSALGVAAFATISNITNRFIDMGVNFAKGFAFGPITDGFHEMETKIGSITTILANTAKFNTKLPEVAAALNDLNDYSDRTIYNFGEMTKNIGLFTNAGIKMEDATSMIKGFSNAAAASGTTAEGAAGAAYQLSQALSNGTVKLMDWRSLTNVGMGNKNMQAGIIQIAQAMGTLEQAGVDSADVTAHFNETLEKGWLTTDVMSTYLKIMAGDMDDAKLSAIGLSQAQIDAFKEQQKTAFDAATKIRTWTQLVGTVKESIGSGWAAIFEQIIGDFEGASSLFTAINNAIGGFVTTVMRAREEMLKTWNAMNGRGTLIEGIVRIFQALGEILNGVKYAFRNLFPATTAVDLLHMTASFSDFSYALKEAVDKYLPKFVYVFGLVFSVIRIGVNIVKGITGLFVDLFKALIPDRSGEHAIGFFGNLARVLYTFNIAVINAGITGFFKGLSKILVPVARLIGTVTGKIIDFFFSLKYSEALQPVLDFFKDGVDRVSGFIDMLSRGIGIFPALGQAFGAAGVKIAGVLQVLEAVFLKVAGVANQFFEILFHRDFVGGPLAEDSKIVSVLFAIRDAFAKVIDTVKSFSFADIFDKDSPKKLDEIKTKLISFSRDVNFQDLSGPKLNLVSGGDWEKEASNTEGFFQRIVDAVTGFFDKIKHLGSNITNFFANVKTSLDKFFTGNGIVDPNKSGFDVVVEIIHKILFLGILFQLNSFMRQFSRLVKSAKGTFDNLSDILQGFGSKTESVASKLLKIAISIALLAGALKLLSEIPAGDLAAAFGAMTVGFAEMGAMMKVMDKSIKDGKNLKKTTTAMILMAGALILFATAVKILASMSLDELERGMGAITGAMLVLGLAVKGLQTDTGSMAGIGVAMIGIATGLLILSAAILAFGNMPLDVIERGLMAVGVALGIIATAVFFMPADQMLAAGLAMIPLALGMTIMAAAVLAFGSMDLGTLARGIGALAITLGLIAGVMHAMPEAGIFAADAAALILVGVAMNVMAKAVKTLGKMKLYDLVKGIGAITTLLSALVIAMAFMEEALPGAAAMLVSAAALVVLAEAIKRVGEMKFGDLVKGIGALTVAVLLLAAAGAFLSPFILALGAAFVVLGVGLTLIGIGAFLGAQAFVYLSDHVGEGTAKILNTLYLLAKELPKVFVEFVKNVATSSQEIAKQTDLIAKALAKMFISALDAIISVIPKVVETVNAIITAIVDFIGSRIVDFVDLGFRIIDALAQGLLNNIGNLTILGVKILLGFIDAILTKLPDLVEAGVRLIVGFIDSLSSHMKELIDAGTRLVIMFIYGIAVNALALVTAAGNMLIAFMDGLAAWIRDNADRIHESGINLAKAIVDGIVIGLLGKDNVDKVVNAIKGLANSVKDGFMHAIGAASPSKDFMVMAGYMAQGVAIGLDNDKLAQNSAVRHAERIVSAFQETLSNLPNSMDGMDELNPVITPVLDLTKVQVGARGINDLMSASISPDASFDQARLIASTSSQDQAPVDTVPTAPAQITFIQNNHSPKALSTNDVYRNTKSQFAVAKEELNI